jgi:hypothetical protein
LSRNEADQLLYFIDADTGLGSLTSHGDVGAEFSSLYGEVLKDNCPGRGSYRVDYHSSPLSLIGVRNWAWSDLVPFLLGSLWVTHPGILLTGKRA